MKKLITFLSLILFTGYTANASHAMGGEITVTVDNNNVAHVTLTIYRDANTGTAALSNSSFVALESISSPSSPTQNIPVTRTTLDTLPSNYPTERHVYTGSIQLTSNGNYLVSWSICCRNASIINFNNPSSYNLYLKTEFTSYSSAQSSTPIFLNAPMVSFPLDTMWTYNPLPYSTSGDSLYWSIDVPLSAPYQAVQGYIAPAANVNGPFTMNPNTGLITWWPSQIGNYAVSILVEEFSSGTKIAEIRRDMQFSVFPDTSSMQFSSPNSLSLANGNPFDNVIAGAPYSLTFELASNDNNAALNLIGTGEPLELSQSNASFQTQTISNNSIEGTFTWHPSLSDIRTKPYVLNIRATDGAYNYDFSVELYLNTGVGLDESTLLSNNMSIYPNPSNGNIKLSLKQVPKSECTFEVLNLQGQRIQEIQIDRNSLMQGAQLNIDAAPGTYIIRLKGEEAQSKVFVIQ
ncbi:T9SS type A sorting domain-containing protein [Owenweeksia hongkongensis]|uniref:T9SS type A sorting domain-containing protein n=1 Tax=Owenweeksia hongkongensis TaxID=253245 RepID=UPI003A950ECE